MSISLEDTAEAISTLKLSKAARPDGIDPEHLVYGGFALVHHLTVLFNAIISTGHIPASFPHGLVVSIPKGHKKDLQ